MLGRIVVGAAGPVALTVASATANPVAADTTGPSAERSSSTFNGCNYHAYQPFFRSGSNSYLEFWAGFDCPGGGGYSLDIFVQKKGIGSSTWATPNTPQTHLNWRADTPWNYYNYLGQFC
ncbi:hypothetical protein, partial [Frankia sp. EI5c]|uniref:hypothetical protein n=1 Tax=Frankia sp. EI5c TaxID=683316 RepID=UPI001A7EB04D